MVTLTESFSPLKSELHNLPCWSPKQKCALSHTIPFYTRYTTTRLNRFSPASASSNQPVRLAWSANCVAGNFHWDADVIFNRYFNCQMICIGKTRGWGRCVVYKMNPLHTSPFWLNIVLDVPKLKITQAHIPYTYTSQIIFFDLFTFSVRVNNPWPNAICFVLFQNCHLVSLIVLVLQWMLKWSKRVSLRPVSFTNYPTLHHPLLSTFLFFTFLFLYMFTNFTHHQILHYTKDTKSNTHKISVTQLDTHDTQ